MNRTKVLVFQLLVALIAFVVFHAKSIEAGESPKYIFIFMADGAGISHLEFARWYGRHIHGEGMTIADKIMREGHSGLMTTDSADSLVTDSAASATALAMGCKAKNRSVGICADGATPKNALEWAKERKNRIGLVTNAPVYDASPAAFASRVIDRRLYRSIIDQYLRLEVDLLLGGGRDEFLARRGDNGGDAIALFKERGYEYVSERRGLAESRGQRVLGLFSSGDMPGVLEPGHGAGPSLSEMTEAAVRILRQGNPAGFFLFVENENIDTASHFSDAASAMREFREFDRAVEAAYRFYKEHPGETLLLIASDHETGGLQLLQNASPEGFKKMESIRLSVRKAVELLGRKPSSEAVDRVMERYFPGFALRPEWRAALVQGWPLTPAFSNPAASILGAVVGSQNGAVWTTSGHTNQPVFLAALGPGAESFRGYLDNAEVGRRLLSILKGR